MPPCPPWKIISATQLTPTLRLNSSQDALAVYILPSRSRRRRRSKSRARRSMQRFPRANWIESVSRSLEGGTRASRSFLAAAFHPRRNTMQTEAATDARGIKLSACASGINNVFFFGFCSFSGRGGATRGRLI